MGYYKNKNWYSSDKLTKCIVIDNVNGKVVGRTYRNVVDTPVTLERFKNFVKKEFPNAEYFNMYDKKRVFIRREYVKNK